MTIIPGKTNNREIIKKAVAGCDGVLTVLIPWGVQNYSSGTAQAVLDYAKPGARLIFSCGWHITRDGEDVYSPTFLRLVTMGGKVARFFRLVDIDDQVNAFRRIFASDTLWTVVRGSSLEEGESQGLPVWSRHVGDPILESDITRRTDFALFMVEALKNKALNHEAPLLKPVIWYLESVFSKRSHFGKDSQSYQSTIYNFQSTIFKTNPFYPLCFSEDSVAKLQNEPILLYVF